MKTFLHKKNYFFFIFFNGKKVRVKAHTMSVTLYQDQHLIVSQKRKKENFRIYVFIMQRVKFHVKKFVFQFAPITLVPN